MTKSTYTLLMTKGHGQINWCELDADEWAFCDASPERYQIFVIDGLEVKILVASEDFTQTRQEALKTASSFVFGRYETIVVDLKRLIGSIEKGVDHRPKNNHPPY